MTKKTQTKSIPETADKLTYHDAHHLYKEITLILSKNAKSETDGCLKRLAAQRKRGTGRCFCYTLSTHLTARHKHGIQWLAWPHRNYMAE